MIIHLTGSDTYRSAQRLAELRAAFVAKHDPTGMNTVTVDGSETTVTEIHNALGASGFFAKKRFVAIDRYVPSSKLKPAELAEALEHVSDLKHDVIVVVRELTAEKPTTKSSGGKRSVGKLTFAQAKLETFPMLTPVQAATWIQKFIADRGGKIVPAAAQRFVALCNGESWRMATEAEKLSLFAGGQPITVADVETMVIGEERQDLFALTDAIGTKQTARALALIHRELEAGTNAFALLATLAGHLRNLWQVKRAVEQGQNPATIASSLALHPYVVQKSIAQGRLFTAEELQNLHHRLLTIDHTLKTSPLDAETLFDLVVVPN